MTEKQGWTIILTNLSLR